jgi:hypothetical protein
MDDYWDAHLEIQTWQCELQGLRQLAKVKSLDGWLAIGFISIRTELGTYSMFLM